MCLGFYGGVVWRRFKLSRSATEKLLNSTKARCLFTDDALQMIKPSGELINLILRGMILNHEISVTQRMTGAWLKISEVASSPGGEKRPLLR